MAKSFRIPFICPNRSKDAIKLTTSSLELGLIETVLHTLRFSLLLELTYTPTIPVKYVEDQPAHHLQGDCSFSWNEEAEVKHDKW
jgi:hypothetical protein